MGSTVDGTRSLIRWTCTGGNAIGRCPGIGPTVSTERDPDEALATCDVPVEVPADARTPPTVIPNASRTVNTRRRRGTILNPLVRINVYSTVARALIIMVHPAVSEGSDRTAARIDLIPAYPGAFGQMPAPFTRRLNLNSATLAFTWRAIRCRSHCNPYPRPIS